MRLKHSYLPRNLEHMSIYDTLGVEAVSAKIRGQSI